MGRCGFVVEEGVEGQGGGDSVFGQQYDDEMGMADLNDVGMLEGGRAGDSPTVQIGSVSRVQIHEAPRGFAVGNARRRFRNCSRQEGAMEA
jgi:hypothetical protein